MLFNVADGALEMLHRYRRIEHGVLLGERVDRRADAAEALLNRRQQTYLLARAQLAPRSAALLAAPLLRQLRLDFRHLRGLRGDGFVYRVGLLARQRPALLRLVRNVRAAAQPRDRRVGFILVAEKFLDRLDFLREQVVALLERHVDVRAALLDLHREAAQPVVNRNISDDCGERRASRYHVRLHREIVLLRRPQCAARRHNYTTGPA